MKQNKFNPKEVKPYNNCENKTGQLIRMFDHISGQYDKFNQLMSLGCAKNWRKWALKSLQPYQPKIILDVATGTADMCIKTFQYLHPEKVVGVDISEKMLEIGRQKIKKANLTNKIDLFQQDCSQLFFENETFDAVTIAFGIRNFERLDESLKEIHRVLKTQKYLLILELNEPQRRWVKKLYQFYIRWYVNKGLQYLSNDKEAYQYLATSMEAFPSGKNLIEIVIHYGFKLLKYKKFTFGVCSLYLFQKEE